MSRIVPLFAIGLFLAVAAAVGASGSGIRGRVTRSPICPVERMPPDPACAPQGFKAKVRVFRMSDKHVVARLTTGDDGRFRVRLRPGRYGVSAASTAGGPFPRCPGPVKATVRSGSYARVTIGCDSGIR